MPLSRSLTSRIVALASMGVLLLGVGIASLTAYFLYHESHHLAHDRLDASMRVAWHVLGCERKDFFQKEGKLYGCGRLLNGDNELVDKIVELVGGTATIFMDDIRVATTIRAPDGTRAIGTILASLAAREDLYDQKKTFRGEVQILDTDYIAAYDPLFDKHGDVVGALFVGLEKSKFYAAVDQTVGLICFFSILSMVLVCAASLYVARNIARPVSAMTAAMHAMAQGDMDVALPDCGSAIEIADMTRTLEAFRTNAKSLHTLMQERETLIQEAERANAAKSEFLTGIGHEIRAPINSIQGMTHLLLDTELPDEQKSWVRIIHHSAQALLDLINDMLDLTRIDSGEIKLEETPFDICATLATASGVFAMKAREKGIELLFRISRDVPAVLIGDAARLRQILINLVDTAIKTTDQGHVLVRVFPIGLEATRAALRFEVEDTGLSVPPDKIDTLFETIGTPDASLLRKDGTTGLGLAISNKLAKLMGGKIKVRSQPLQGKTFSFEALLKRPQENVAETYTPETDLDGVRALIVDEYPASRAILQDALSQLGLTCDTIDSLAQTKTRLERQKIEGTPYAFVFVDNKLSGDDILSFCLSAGCDAEEEGPLLVVLSNHGQAPSEDALQVSKASAHLLKPYRPEQLEAVVKTLWEARKRNIPVPFVSPQRLSLRLRKPEDPLPDFPVSSCIMRVLVADDMPVNRLLLTKILENCNCCVDVAKDGHEAVRKAEAANHHLIFMDCMMGGMDGYTASGLIRRKERPHGAHTPIIGLCSQVKEEDRRRCFGAGMDDCLCKPFRPADVIEVLRKWGRL